ncbi:hypothetical protein BGX38DRAFT_1197792, partial [Terfezia claveryi]
MVYRSGHWRYGTVDIGAIESHGRCRHRSHESVDIAGITVSILELSQRLCCCRA